MTDCPLCGAPATPANKPFCSRGCKDRDLLRWLDEGYRIPVALGSIEALDSTPDRD